MSIKRDGTEVFTPPINTEGLSMCLTCTAPESRGLAMAMVNTKRIILIEDDLYPSSPKKRLKANPPANRKNIAIRITTCWRILSSF